MIIKNNLIMYLIIGYPGCGKTTYRYKLQKTHADKSINFMAWADTIADYIGNGLSPTKAIELVTMLTESNISNKYDIYILEDVPEISMRTRLCEFAKSQGYSIIIVNFLTPRLIKEKKVGEYVDWFWSIKKSNKTTDILTKIPKDEPKAIKFIKNFEIKYDLISKDEQDNFQVINVKSYSDLYVMNSLVK